MKIKHYVIVLTLVLMLFCVPAHAAQYAPSENSYSFTYPDEWTIDTLSYTSSNTDDSLWLCDFHPAGCIIELDMINYTDLYRTMSLYSANEAQMNLYMQDIVSSYESSGETARYLETYQVAYADAQIPFLIYQVTGSKNGDFYYADTLANGWSITLYAYSESETALDPKCLEHLKTLLSGFVPIV